MKLGLSLIRTSTVWLKRESQWNFNLWLCYYTLPSHPQHSSLPYWIFSPPAIFTQIDKLMQYSSRNKPCHLELFIFPQCYTVLNIISSTFIQAPVVLSLPPFPHYICLSSFHIQHLHSFCLVIISVAQTTKTFFKEFPKQRKSLTEYCSTGEVQHMLSSSTPAAVNQERDGETTACKTQFEYPVGVLSGSSTVVDDEECEYLKTELCSAVEQASSVSWSK